MVGMMMAMTSICVAFIAMPPITSAEYSPSSLRKISLHEPLATPPSAVVARAPCIGGRYPKMPAARWLNFGHQPRALAHGLVTEADMVRAEHSKGCQYGVRGTTSRQAAEARILLPL